MRFIAKTLVLSPSAAKWKIYAGRFREFFAGRNADYDRFIDFCSDFYDQFDACPTLEAVERELQAANDSALLGQIRGLVADPTVPVHTADDVFAAALDAERPTATKATAVGLVDLFKTSMEASAVRESQILAARDTLVSGLYDACARMRAIKPVSLVHYGEAARQDFRAHYAELEARKARDGSLYYDLPFPSLSEVQIKRGDLVCVGAFTSQGKSALLRQLAYHFLAEHGLNVLFCSLEVDARTVQRQFAVLHANNKGVFPHTPRIAERAFKNADLSEEEADFLLEVAFKDLTENHNYGTLKIEERGQARFTLPELMRRVSETARLMPVHVLVVDYVTIMTPVADPRWRPQAEDLYEVPSVKWCFGSLGSSSGGC